MALINTTDELREFYPVSRDMAFNKVKPDLDHVESHVLLEMFGQTALDNADATLQMYLKRACTFLGLEQAIDVLQAKFGDGGLQREESDNFKTPFKYQVDALRKKLLTKGFEATESALTYLEVNPILFPFWAASEYSTVNKDLFIWTAAIFNKHYNIRQSRVTFLRLIPTMRYANAIVEDAIGADLSATIHFQVKAGALTEDNKTLLDGYIQPAFALLTIAEALGDLNVEFGSDGALIAHHTAPEGDQLVAASETAISTKRTLVQDRAGYYLSRMKEFLRNNASETVYSEYYHSSLYPTETPDPEEDEGSVYLA